MRQQAQDSGYVDPDVIRALARDSYDASDLYGKITKKYLPDTDDAHRHLTGSDGEATDADRELVALIEEFEQYLNTSTARYYVAAERLVTAAKRYDEAEGMNQDQLERIIDQQDEHKDHYEGSGNPNREARDTDRPGRANEATPEDFK
jgi:hypothetical protein